MTGGCVGAGEGSNDVAWQSLPGHFFCRYTFLFIAFVVFHRNEHKFRNYRFFCPSIASGLRAATLSSGLVVGWLQKIARESIPSAQFSVLGFCSGVSAGNRCGIFFAHTTWRRWLDVGVRVRQVCVVYRLVADFNRCGMFGWCLYERVWLVYSGFANVLRK